MDLLRSAYHFGRRTFRPFSSLWLDAVGRFALLGVPIAVRLGWSRQTGLTVSHVIPVVLAGAPGSSYSVNTTNGPPMAVWWR